MSTDKVEALSLHSAHHDFLCSLELLARGRVVVLVAQDRSCAPWQTPPTNHNTASPKIRLNCAARICDDSGAVSVTTVVTNMLPQERVVAGAAITSLRRRFSRLQSTRLVDRFVVQELSAR